jgi:hypothetical protein
MVFAKPSVQQTTPSCPTYQVNLVVDLVNSDPTNPQVGDTVVTRVHVVYNDGTPVTLSPETISFLWTGTAGQKEFDNVAVVYTGEPGFYNYTETVTQDIFQAVGQGKVTIAVVACSCSDIRGNRGPISPVNSDATLTPSDNSNLLVGPQTQPPQPMNYLVPAAIAILLIIALLLFFMRKKGQKKK